MQTDEFVALSVQLTIAGFLFWFFYTVVFTVLNILSPVRGFNSVMFHDIPFWAFDSPARTKTLPTDHKGIRGETVKSVFKKTPFLRQRFLEVFVERNELVQVDESNNLSAVMLDNVVISINLCLFTPSFSDCGISNRIDFSVIFFLSVRRPLSFAHCINGTSSFKFRDEMRTKTVRSIKPSTVLIE